MSINLTLTTGRFERGDAYGVQEWVLIRQFGHVPRFVVISTCECAFLCASEHHRVSKVRREQRFSALCHELVTWFHFV